MKLNKKNISVLQCFLTVLYTSCLLISNIITSKQISLPFGITMTCAILVFPITYILSDVFSEIYGYKFSRYTCYLSFIMNIIMVLFFTASIKLKPSPFYTGDAAFAATLGNTPRILFASLAAFVAGDFINDNIFQFFKKREDKYKSFGWRAIISSLGGELMDSLIFIPIAFYGTLPVSNMIVMLFTQVGLKVGYELIILPLTTMFVKKIKTIEADCA